VRQRLSGLEKSAILLLSLPDEQAQAILARLDADVADEIQSEIETLGEIDPRERSDVLAEYTAAMSDASGSASDDSGDAPDALHGWDALDLAERLHDEHPQTIAAVLSMTSTDKSGRCIGRFPVQRQIDVFCRMKAIRPLAPIIRDNLLDALGNPPCRCERRSIMDEPSAESRLLSQVLDAALQSRGEL
jgi:flagellar motor switch protein FliG